jgi:hypothetical protein
MVPEELILARHSLEMPLVVPLVCPTAQTVLELSMAMPEFARTPGRPDWRYSVRVALVPGLVSLSRPASLP